MKYLRLTKDEVKRIQRYIFDLEETLEDEGYFCEALGYKGKTATIMNKLNKFAGI